MLSIGTLVAVVVVVAVGLSALLVLALGPGPINHERLDDEERDRA